MFYCYLEPNVFRANNFELSASLRIQKLRCWLFYKTIFLQICTFVSMLSYCSMTCNIFTHKDMILEVFLNERPTESIDIKRISNVLSRLFLN
jgi:hypothetical protein